MTRCFWQTVEAKSKTIGCWVRRRNNLCSHSVLYMYMYIIFLVTSVQLFHHLSLKAGKLVRLVHRYSSPALVAPDSVAAESAPVPKKRWLSLSLRKRPGRLARDLVQHTVIAQVITWLRRTIVYIAHSSLLPQYYNFHHSSIISTAGKL